MKKRCSILRCTWIMIMMEILTLLVSLHGVDVNWSTTNFSQQYEICRNRWLSSYSKQKETRVKMKEPLYNQKNFKMKDWYIGRLKLIPMVVVVLCIYCWIFVQWRLMIGAISQIQSKWPSFWSLSCLGQIMSFLDLAQSMKLQVQMMHLFASGIIVFFLVYMKWLYFLSTGPFILLNKVVLITKYEEQLYSQLKDRQLLDLNWDP